MLTCLTWRTPRPLQAIAAQVWRKLWDCQPGGSAEWLASPSVHCRAQDGMVCAGLFLKALRRHWVLPEKVGPHALPDSQPGLVSWAPLAIPALLRRLVQERDQNVGLVAIEESLGHTAICGKEHWVAEGQGAPYLDRYPCCLCRRGPEPQGSQERACSQNLSLLSEPELALRRKKGGPFPPRVQAAPSYMLSHWPRESIPGSDSK